MADAAEITTLARTQVQRVDRVLGEALDRLRMQLVHADQILDRRARDRRRHREPSSALGIGPVQSVGALVRGVQTGVEFFATAQGVAALAEAPSETQDESLFI